jgi:hypothetical protein
MRLPLCHGLVDFNHPKGCNPTESVAPGDGETSTRLGRKLRNLEGAGQANAKQHSTSPPNPISSQTSDYNLNRAGVDFAVLMTVRTFKL